MKRSAEVGTGSTRRRRRAASSDVGPAPSYKKATAGTVSAPATDKAARKTVRNPVNQGVVVLATALGVINDSGHLRKQDEIESALERIFNFGNGVHLLDVQVIARDGLFLRFAPFASDGKTQLEPLLLQLFPQGAEDTSIQSPAERPGGYLFT